MLGIMKNYNESYLIEYLSGTLGDKLDNKLRQEGAAIVPLIDYYSAMWYDSSISDVLSFYGIEFNEIFLEDSFKMYAGLRAQKESYIFRFNNIELSVPLVLYYYQHEKYNGDFDQVLNFKFKDIRLNLSGDAMSYMRSKREDFDLFLRSTYMMTDKVKVTRIDITFDFLNWDVDLVDALTRYCRRVEDEIPSGLIGICNSPACLSFSVKSGSRERSVYLGSSGSDKLLRVYDKYLQFYTKEGILKDINKPCPYGDQIKSWTRIELQLRENRCGYAQQWLYSSTTDEDFFFSCLKRIIDDYKFLDIDEKRYKQQPAKFWSSLWDLTDIDSLILNRNCVPKEEKPYVQKIHDFIERHQVTIASLIDYGGLITFAKSYNNFAQQVNNGDPLNPQHDHQLQRQRLKFINGRLSYGTDPDARFEIPFKNGLFPYINLKKLEELLDDNRAELWKENL